MKMIVSAVLGIVLLISLTALTNYTNETFLGARFSKEVTLLKDGDSLKLGSGDCRDIPDDLRQYCNNISIQRYGYLFSTAKDNKDVPDNAYVGTLGYTAYQYCVSGSFTSHCHDFTSANDLKNDTRTILFLVTELSVVLFACSWVVYYLLSRFYFTK